MSASKAKVRDLKKEILEYLKKTGPTPRRILIKDLKIREYQLTAALPEGVAVVHFTKGMKKRYSSYDIFGELVKLGKLLFLRDDPRIVEYVAERIPLRPKTPHEARALYTNLKEHLGEKVSRAVVEKLGYKYKNKGAV